jgi:D-glycero-D-manno-heptose 1,7-bisphosphate phosphatase
MIQRSFKRRAILLDRDGTVCREVGYIDSPDKIELLPGSAEAIGEASKAGYQVVLITNQAGIARRLFDEETLADVHDRLRELLGEHGARLDGIYYCPHHPDADHPTYGGECDCRKPKPGLLTRARDEMGIDLAGSYMIGDHGRDAAAAIEAGVVPIMVRTGHGARQLEDPEHRARLQSVHVEDDLRAAVRWILDRERSPA